MNFIRLKKKIRAIIIAPTRELAQQIDQQFDGFSYFAHVSSMAVYGGGDGKEWVKQSESLNKGTEVIIATPGRLLSFLSLANIDLSGVEYLILDEADRMLDMGLIMTSCVLLISSQRRDKPCCFLLQCLQK